MNVEQLDRAGRWFLWMLMIMMILRICSYFTLFPSSIGLTRVVKIGLRFALTGISGLLYLQYKSENPFHKFSFKMATPLGLYVAYLALGVVSLLWSTGVGFSALQLAMTIESMVFVYMYFQLLLLFESKYGVTRTLFSRILARSIFWCSVAFIAGIFIDPDLFYRDTHGGAVRRLGGFIINPNELGMLAVLGISMGYIELLNKRDTFMNVLILIGCIACLLLTQSRSSLGAFVLVSGIYVLLMDNYFIKASVITVGVLITPVVLNTIVFKEGNVEEVMSMTGRLPFWTDLIGNAFPDRPILGYGFMRISPSTYTDKFESIHAYAASMTHNTFVQVLINLGLVGAFICLLQMVTTFYAIGIEKDKWLTWMAVWMLIPLIINSITEFGIFGESNYGIMFYQFVIMFFTLRAYKIEKPQNDFLEMIMLSKK